MAAPQPHGGAADSYYNEAPAPAPSQRVPENYNSQQPNYSSQQPNYNSQQPNYNMQQPNQYAQEEPKYTQGPPRYGQIHAPDSGAADDKRTYDQAFHIAKPKYNDIWAGILLILVFLGFTAVSGLTIQGYASTKGFQGGSIYSGNNDFSLSTNTIILFIFVLCVALFVSWGYFMLARLFTKQFIWITGILQIVFGIGTAIVYFARHYYSAAIVFLIFSVFYIICFISWIPRIPFSVLILQTVMDVAKKYGHMYTVSFLGGFIAMAFSAWFSVTLTAVYVKYEPSQSGTNPACASGGCSRAKVIGLLVFITFAGYWISEWLRQTIHTTIAGVYGSWYFCSQKAGGMPKAATRGAFKRAMTYSFGSISFGSLMVSVIQLLRQAVSIAQRSEAQQGNMVGSMLFCLLGCLVGLLDWAVTFINHYAFSHIALYGKAYVPAAKDTWRMMKDRGVDALVNECLIDPVLTMGATFVAYLAAFLAYLYLSFTAPAYNEGGAYTPVVMAFAFLIGLQICNVFVTPIKSGVATLFVAMAWDPQVMMEDHRDLWERMVAVYPHVQTAIHA